MQVFLHEFYHNKGQRQVNTACGTYLDQKGQKRGKAQITQNPGYAQFCCTAQEERPDGGIQLTQGINIADVHQLIDAYGQLGTEGADDCAGGLHDGNEQRIEYQIHPGPKEYRAQVHIFLAERDQILGLDHVDDAHGDHHQGQIYGEHDGFRIPRPQEERHKHRRHTGNAKTQGAADEHDQPHGSTQGLGQGGVILFLGQAGKPGQHNGAKGGHDAFGQVDDAVGVVIERHRFVAGNKAQHQLVHPVIDAQGGQGQKELQIGLDMHFDFLPADADGFYLFQKEREQQQLLQQEAGGHDEGV